jgi:hypothetical protein
MKRNTNIEALIKNSRTTFAHLQKEYDASLHEKTVRENLKIDIKNILGNLRSCLDYLAHDLFDTLCVGTKRPRHLYFPIRHTGDKFQKMMRDEYSTLEANNKEVFDFLDSIQPYNSPWLGQMNELNNENKHQDLVEQTRTELRQVTITTNLGSASWSSGAVFGSGAVVMGVPIDVRTQMPVKNNHSNTSVLIWVDFQFKDNGLSVLPFISNSISNVENIFLTLKKHL